MSFNVVCFSICFIRLEIMATSHIFSTPVLFTDFLHLILLFSIHCFHIFSFTISDNIIIPPTHSNQLIGIHPRLLLFYYYQIHELPYKFNLYMACILLCDNDHDYLHEQTPLKQYFSEIRHIHSSEKLEPCYFPWIYLVFKQQELQRDINLMLALFLSNLIL